MWPETNCACGRAERRCAALFSFAVLDAVLFKFLIVPRSRKRGRSPRPIRSVKSFCRVVSIVAVLFGCVPICGGCCAILICNPAFVLHRVWNKRLQNSEISSLFAQNTYLPVGAATFIALPSSKEDRHDRRS